MAKFVPNIKGFYELRSSPELIAELERKARIVKAVAESHGDGSEYRIWSTQGKKDPQGRWRVSVTTDNVEAILANARDFTLVTALDSARG